MDKNRKNIAISELEDLLKTIDSLSESEKREYSSYLASTYALEKEKADQEEMESYLKSRQLYGGGGLLKLLGVMISFMPYICSSPNFEIFFSEKYGAYFIGRFIGPDLEDPHRIEIENSWIIENADDLFDFLSNEIINDVFELKMNGEHFDNTLQENEITELIRRLEPYLNAFDAETKDYYAKRFSTNLDNWMEDK